LSYWPLSGSVYFTFIHQSRRRRGSYLYQISADNDHRSPCRSGHSDRNLFNNFRNHARTYRTAAFPNRKSQSIFHRNRRN